LAGYVASRTDYNNNVTQYTYDGSRGLETSRTEAYGTPRARTITTQWHTTYRLPVLISIYAGGSASGTPLRTTSFTYDSSGNALTRTVTDPVASSSRTWTYTYDGYGRVLTEDGPRTDVSDITTYTYYTCATGHECGQVHTVTNALGQTTTFNTYNVNGQPLTITDPNGVVITLAYNARQRLTSRTVANESTTFEYWPTGLEESHTAKRNVPPIHLRCGTSAVHD
jgi:YD repeat-containing protein